MIITVTTSTISTITSVTTVVAMGLTAAISIIAVATLVGFLATKELASVTNSSFPQRLAGFLSIGILPLVMVFAAIVAVNIAVALG